MIASLFVCVDIMNCEEFLFGRGRIVVRATHDVCQEIQHFECRCQTCCSDAKNLKKLAIGELS